MGKLIGSAEWVEEYIEKLNGNKNYEEAASDWEGDFLFITTDVPQTDKNVDKVKRFNFYIDLWHGKCREGRLIDEGEEKGGEKVEYVITGKYKDWKKVYMGELDSIKAMMMGKLKLEGNMAKIMRYTKAASELVKTIAMIDTEYYD
ncbi:MAG: SCP2 sterol-binding domain-containing protein [Promethearchaeota archaeon]